MASTADSVIDLLTSDHRRIEERLRQLRAAADPEERRRLADLVIIESVRHGVIEEMYLDPVVGKAIPNGAARVAKEMDEHARIERIFKELEQTDAASPEFEALVTTLMTEVHQHIINEEYSLFPWFAQHVDGSELAELGGQIQDFEDNAPNVTRGPGLVDRLREILGADRHR